ncbi:MULTISPECIES: glycosyltransferase [unclassified Methanoculleus]|jgi:glycosyltransferase involved in cell wall biosynthesis|uniref:glycosyltransferase n=1 Tax=unclassified Methanoculleus TaxID=2619537 RepID=UPI0025F98C84|nr:glycosyltransferase [Methanoculleus sp. UBA377]
MTIHTTSSSAPARTAGMVVEHDGDREGTILLVDDEATRPRPAVRTLVAMPAYNEEAYIAKTIIGAKKHGDAVLVVDDGSKDDTVPIAEGLGARVVRHEVNRGYGGALQTIFATARNLGAEELVVIDADGQHNPAEIPELLAELRRGNDVVIGSRFVKGSAGKIPAYRKAGMKVLDTATTLAGTNLAITDSQSGFRAYGRKAIEAIQISGEGMSAGSEILVQASDHRLKVAEVPIKVRYDIEDTSSQNPVSHGVGVLMNIVRLISLRRPLVFFGIPGVLFALIGIVAEIYTFSEYYRTGQFHYIVFTGGFSVLILGLLLTTVGIILYSLVQIMQGQGGGKAAAPVTGAPIGKGAGKAEPGTSH